MHLIKSPGDTETNWICADATNGWTNSIREASSPSAGRVRGQAPPVTFTWALHDEDSAALSHSALFTQHSDGVRVHTSHGFCCLHLKGHLSEREKDQRLIHLKTSGEWEASRRSQWPLQDTHPSLQPWLYKHTQISPFRPISIHKHAFDSIALVHFLHDTYISILWCFAFCIWNVLKKNTKQCKKKNSFYSCNI